MTVKGLFGFLVASTLLAVSAAPAFAQPPKDTLILEGNATQGGSSPTANGANVVYAFTTTECTSLSDTLNLSLRIDNTDGSLGSSYTISFVANGDDSDIVATLPASFSLIDDGVAVSKQIPISIGLLPAGDYSLNIMINTNPGGSAISQPNPSKVHILLHVDECQATAPTCFFTDSGGNFLTDCEGDFVSESSGGRFEIVSGKGKKTVVATNPGQFYYNYLWTNPGGEVEVQILLNGLSANIRPHGANAVHAFTFDTSGFTQDQAAFEMVNKDGTPCGPSGPCTITVGEGETLWVTWHLEVRHGRSNRPERGRDVRGGCGGNHGLRAAGTGQRQQRRGRTDLRCPGAGLQQELGGHSPHLAEGGGPSGPSAFAVDAEQQAGEVGGPRREGAQGTAAT